MLFIAIRKRLDEREEGFTLIELLVVVIIIGILAAVAIPVFLNQRERAWNGAAQSDLRNAAVAQESFFTEGNTYAGPSDLDKLKDEGFNEGNDIIFTIESGDSAGYCMQAKHEAGGLQWHFSSGVGAPAEGSCSGGDDED